MSLRKFTIPARQVLAFRQKLISLGLSPASLFPDFDGAAETAKLQIESALVVEQQAEGTVSGFELPDW